MEKKACDIFFKVIYENEEFELSTYRGEYRSLMMLIYNNIYIEEFGECGGMGRCGTCLIEVIENNHGLDSWDGNEQATIRKMGITNGNIRLACQVEVNETLRDSKLRIYQP